VRGGLALNRARDQRSEIRSQKSEVRSQKSERQGKKVKSRQDHKTTDNRRTGQSAARRSKRQNYKEFDQAYASLPRGSGIGRPSLRAVSIHSSMISSAFFTASA